MSSANLIVHIGNYDPEAFDGVTTTIVGHADGLAAAGKQIEIWSFRSGCSKITKKTSREGAVIWCLPCYSKLRQVLFGFPKITNDWIRSRLNEVRLFHLHSVFSPNNNLVAKLGKPFVITPNGGWGSRVLQGRRRWLKKLWIFWSEGSLWQRASYVHAVSDLEAKELRSLKKMSEVVCIPNGVHLPPSHFEKIWPSSHFLFIGRLAIDQKGLDLLLYGYERALRKEPNLPPLILAGPDFRGGREALSQLVNELDIGDKVKFVGPVRGDEKEDFFAQAIAFVHTSRWEGMPLSILEALARGVPCLVTPETNIADWVETNEAGVVVAGERSSVSAGLLHCFAEKSNFKTIGANARKRSLADFGWRVITDQLYKNYP